MSGKAISFRFLTENKTDKEGITAEHGLSVYIEAHGRKILFDTGATDMLIGNAEKMGVDLSAVDTVVISHGHYDHTGGLPAFCEINRKAPIYIHKNAFRESYELKDGELYGKNDGIRWSAAEMDAIKDRFVLTDGPVYITEDICVTGTVKREMGFVPTEKFYYRGDDGRITEDDMSHEQCLVIRQDGGLYIFSGCSHRGVISALNTGKDMFPGEKAEALIAGMHLVSASDDEIKRVTDRLIDEMPRVVIPVHCTGIRAICEMKSRMGDACVAATVGDVYDGH